MKSNEFILIAKKKKKILVNPFKCCVKEVLV